MTRNWKGRNIDGYHHSNGELKDQVGSSQDDPHLGSFEVVDEKDETYYECKNGSNNYKYCELVEKLCPEIPINSWGNIIVDGFVVLGNR